MMLHVFHLLLLPIVHIIQQLDGDLEEEVLASMIAQYKTGRLFHVVIPILVVVLRTAVMMQVWIEVIGMQLENGTGIGTGMGETGVGFWEGLEDLKREKETGMSSLTVHLRSEGPA
jgi:hypothetical protein